MCICMLYACMYVRVHGNKSQLLTDDMYTVHVRIYSKMQQGTDGCVHSQAKSVLNTLDVHVLKYS
jgi:hypothetical protein